MELKKGKKTIIFISNPFGFGPTAKLYPVIEEFHKRYSHNLVLLTGESTKHIIKKGYLEIIEVDERNPESIGKAIRKFNNPYIVSSLNKFAIQVAKERSLPSVFIDGLSWLWKEIPKEYLLADRYYALNFLGVDEKIEKISNALKIPYILDTAGLNRKEKRKEFILFHVGGFSNPLYNSAEQNYLKLYRNALNKITPNKKVLIAGGYEAVDFLKSGVKGDMFEFATLQKEDFHKSLTSCTKILTTPGLTTSLESFYTKTPVGFLLPSNLSQYKILNLFIQNSLTQSFMLWEYFFPLEEDLNEMEEKACLQYLDTIANKILNNADMTERFNQILHELLTSEPTDTDPQFQFISNIGIDGAEVLVNDLHSFWGLWQTN